MKRWAERRARRRLGRVAALALVAAALAVLAALAVADGARLRLREPVAAGVASVWTSPSPLRVGPVEVLVFLEPAAPAPQAHEPADVRVDLLRDGRSIAAARGAAAPGDDRGPWVARLEAAEPGRLELRVRLGEDGGGGELHTAVEVEPPPSPFAEQGIALALPALGLALFALGRWRARRAAAPVARQST